MSRSLARVVLLGLAAYLLTGVTQVRPEEQAVVRRFGEPVARWGPGLHLGLPWGMDRIDRVAVTSVRQLAVGYEPGMDYTSGPTPVGQYLTADQNLVNVKLTIDYSVRTDGRGLEDFVMSRDQVPAVLARATESLTAEWAAAVPVDRVLLAGNAELPRWLMSQLPERLSLYPLGVRVQQVSVAYLAPPDEVKAAFDEVNRAQSNMLTLENQALQQAARRLGLARAEKYREEQLAESYRREQVRLAGADADAFTHRLEQYHVLRADNPEVLTAIWWDETGKLLQGLKRTGRIDLLDDHLGADGLDVTQFLPARK